MNRTSPPAPHWLTPAEAADTLGVTAATIRRWVRSGALQPTLTTPGGHYRFTEESLRTQVDAFARLAPSHGEPPTDTTPIVVFSDGAPDAA